MKKVVMMVLAVGNLFAAQENAKEDKVYDVDVRGSIEPGKQATINQVPIAPDPNKPLTEVPAITPKLDHVPESQVPVDKTNPTVASPSTDSAVNRGKQPDFSPAEVRAWGISPASEVIVPGGNEPALSPAQNSNSVSSQREVIQGGVPAVQLPANVESVIPGGTSVVKESPAALDAELLSAAIASYIYGYPLVTMGITKDVMTNVVKEDGLKAPQGEFVNARTYPNPSFKDVTAPNADTLYSVAWLDLSKEPYILELPDENGRYYVMPLLSGWTEVFTSLGTRTTGTEASKWAITGPGFKGTLPEEVKEIKAPTNMVWILGRTYSTGTPEDYKLVHEIQDKYQLIPLSSYGKSYKPPQGVFNKEIDTKTPVRTQVNNLSGVEYFKKFADLLKTNPPAAEDKAMIAKLAKIGIVPGQEFDERKVNPAVITAMNEAPKKAFALIVEHYKRSGSRENNWTLTAETGKYGTNYLQRALVTAVGLGANLPQDAIYPMTKVDGTDKPLDGRNNYIIKFRKDQLPPVNGFWSLTMYDDQMFFVENPIKRYSISERDQLKANEDGSVDLYIQASSPGRDKENNWLPSPNGPFVLMFRFYWPKEDIINGTWQPPAVTFVPTQI